MATTGYVISGYVETTDGIGIDNVEMCLSGDISDTVLTDSDGYYEFTNLYAGIYTVTPSKAGWTFNPPRRDYDPLNSDMIEQNFTGIAPCLQWTVKLTISGCGIAQERFFGVHCFATNGFDEGLDVTCPPPGFEFHSYFHMDESPYYLSTDIKAPDAVPLCWTLKIVNATGCTDTLRWNPAELPEMTLLLDGIDMHSESLAIYEGNQTLHIVSRLDTFNISMTAVCGWNLVSIPVIPANSDANAVFPGNCGVFTWDPISSNYVMVDEVEPGIGYWVCYVSPHVIEVTGIPVTTFTRNIGIGWNLIGSIAKNVNFTNPNDNPDGSIIEGSLYGLNPANCGYFSTTIIEPTKGYWVCAAQPCELTVSDPFEFKSLSTSSIESVKDALLWTLDLSIETDDTYPPITLTLGCAVNGTNEFDPTLDKPIPPPSPGATFYAWLEGTHHRFHQLATDIRANSANTWTIFVKAPNEFNVNWNATEIPSDCNLILCVDGKEINMKQYTSYSAKNICGKTMSFNIKKINIPRTFKLLQNSPNPFANTTTIGFQLPFNSNVTINIYDMVGRKICELLNQHMDAGYHIVCWDGRNSLGYRVKEGVYFYRIRTYKGSGIIQYEDTKKMVLLR